MILQRMCRLKLVSNLGINLLQFTIENSAHLYNVLAKLHILKLVIEHYDRSWRVGVGGY